MIMLVAKKMKWCAYGPKTLQIRNVQKMNKLYSKLMTLLLSVTFTGTDKHASLLRNPYIDNM